MLTYLVGVVVEVERVLVLHWDECCSVSLSNWRPTREKIITRKFRLLRWTEKSDSSPDADPA
jgi:hypothetical protein